VPQVQEDYHLVCLRDVLESASVQALQRTLASTAWREHLADLPGYAAHPQAGSVQALVQVLPWWTLKPKRVDTAPASPTSPISPT
jgi:putative molybdopterin biosynthesis protein